ncbi:alpha/beta hydrolase [Xanthobacter aminoxidans]|uniref:alpha/beta hydrolase n=1 Tax=Xanthobacter aminoxidans TaxID=186280 RepID=UPI002022E8F6|nr:alpha/beta hydrolase [Xanthobacter aminoxidans]
MLFQALLKLPESWLRQLAGLVAPGAPSRGDWVEADPRARLHAWLVTRCGAPPTADPAAARQPRFLSLRLLEGRPLPLRDCRDLMLPGPDGPLRARLYTPHACPEPAPALIYLHFGGCVVGDLATCHTACTILAHHARCKVLSVEYRLAPEHKFPAALEDAVGALRWLRSAAPSLGIAPHQIGIGGDSAGGYLAAATSLQLKQSGEPPPKMQLLIYPVLEMDRDRMPATAFDHCYPLTRADMDWFSAQYLRSPADAANPLCSVARARLLDGMPATLIVQARHDLLYEEGRRFAERLEAQGVPLARRVYPTLPHAFSAMSGGLPAARAALIETAELAGQMLRAPVDAPSRTFMETCDE